MRLVQVMIIHRFLWRSESAVVVHAVHEVRLQVNLSLFQTFGYGNDFFFLRYFEI